MGRNFLRKRQRGHSPSHRVNDPALVVLLMVPAWFIWRYVSPMIRITAQNGTIGMHLPDGTWQP